MKAMVRFLLVLGKLYYFFKVETSAARHEICEALDVVSANQCTIYFTLCVHLYLQLLN